MVYVVGVREATHIFLRKVPDAPELQRSQCQQFAIGLSAAAGLPFSLSFCIRLSWGFRLVRMYRALL